MKKRLKFTILYQIAFLSLILQMSGHDIPVHWAITFNAAQSAFDESSAYSGFVGLIASDFSYLGQPGATNSLVLGSGFEDRIDFPGDVGGKRSFNHFYDPLDSTYGKGLSDSPKDRRFLTGTNSFDWASVSNCMGVNFPGVTWFGIGANINTSNIWSWQNARGYEWNGLTATNQLARQTNLANMFRAVGQVMHLLEDASQPQHVRNEQHLDQFFNGFNTPWRSHIEDYGLAHSNTLNYTHGVLDWRGDGFSKLEDFWDRHAYNGSAAALNAETNGGSSELGLAEWCNGNFLGERHKYGEYYSTADIRHYPYPSLFTSTDYLRGGAYVDAVTLDNGQTVNRIYLHKTGDGIQIGHFSVAGYLGTRFPNRVFPTGTTINDNNVLSNYHNAFIPKAVEYSAGLLDYYFRGMLYVSPTGYDTNTFQYSNIVKNVSGESFKNGAFYAYIDGSNSVRQLIGQTNWSGVLTNGQSVSMNLTNATTNRVLVVYKGTIGLDNHGNALDPIDTNIAIAAEYGSGFSGLIGWWPGNGNANDLVGGNDGVATTNIYYVPGQIKQAFAFDPESNSPVRIRVPDNPVYVLTNALSIECWVRPRAYSFIIFYRGDSRLGYDPYVLAMQGNSNVAFQVTGEDGVTASIQTALNTNVWTHLAATFDTRTMQLYTNGILAVQDTNTMVVPMGQLISTNDPGIGIGNTHDTNSDFPFEGDINSVSLYNRALTATEIEFIYTNGLVGKDYHQLPFQ